MIKYTIALAILVILLGTMWWRNRGYAGVGRKVTENVKKSFASEGHIVDGDRILCNVEIEGLGSQFAAVEAAKLTVDYMFDAQTGKMAQPQMEHPQPYYPSSAPPVQCPTSTPNMSQAGYSIGNGEDEDIAAHLNGGPMYQNQGQLPPGDGGENAPLPPELQPVTCSKYKGGPTGDCPPAYNLGV